MIIFCCFIKLERKVGLLNDWLDDIIFKVHLTTLGSYPFHLFKLYLLRNIKRWFIYPAIDLIFMGDVKKEKVIDQSRLVFPLKMFIFLVTLDMQSKLANFNYFHPGSHLWNIFMLRRMSIEIISSLNWGKNFLKLILWRGRFVWKLWSLWQKHCFNLLIL